MPHDSARLIVHRASVASILAILCIAVLPGIGPAAALPVQGGAKDMTFFLHYWPSAESVGGVSTNYLANTASSFQYVKNHDVKGVGQPKVQVDFYLFPALAGDVHISGDWQVIVFANSTALHPANWGLEFWEKSSTGTVLWDSGALTPSVVGGPSSRNGYVDSPIYGYTLTASGLDHTFSVGDTLEVEITVNTGATVPLSVWYDSAQQPSRMILPSENYMHISGVSTSDANGTLRSVFFTYWRASQRNVTVRTLVTDPFGGYDIHRVLVSLMDPGGSWIVSNSTMKKIFGTGSSYNNTYAYRFAYAANASRGNYTVFVTALDNNAENQFEHTGTYAPFADFASVQFSIGLLFPIHVRVFDTHGAPLDMATVSFFSGDVEYATGLTGRNGVYNASLSTGDYVAMVWWEGVPVLSQNVSVRGISLVNLTAAVYYPTFKFVDDVQNPLAGVLVFLHFPNGSTSQLPLVTDDLGSLTLRQQPIGSYVTLVIFQGVEVADSATQITSDGPFVVTTMVYQLGVTVVNNGGSPLNGSSVLISSPGKANGGAYGFLITGPSGRVNFSLPIGQYAVTAEYHGNYLLSSVSNRTTIDVLVNHDTSLTIKMSNLPPPVWLTLGFQLALVVVLVLVGLTALLVVRRRKAHRIRPTG